jgi:hypothetical protein
MSDISISFPPWMIAWLLLGEATPLITLVLMSLAAAFFFSRGTRHIRLTPREMGIPVRQFTGERPAAADSAP